MPDIRLEEQSQDLPGGVSSIKHNAQLDWVITSNGIDETEDLATAIRLALGTDHLANPDDTLPDNYSNDLRGWWGDLDAGSIWGGWNVGSRLWEMQRDKLTFSGYRKGSTTAKVINFVTEAMQPFVDNKIIKTYTIDVKEKGRDRIEVSLILYRTMQPAVTLRYAILVKSLLNM